METLDVAIIGGGPAGLTAATYLQRSHRSCLVFDTGASRARWIPESNNCPGFPQGVSGDELLRRMRCQAAEFGTRFESAAVQELRGTDGAFVLRAGARSWQARKLVLALGLSDQLPDQPWVEDAIACGALRLCPVCDAFEVSDTRIGVYGPGSTIAPHARFLRVYSSEVFLLASDRGEDGADFAEALSAGAKALPGGGRLDFDGHHCTYAPPGGEAVGFDTIYLFMGSDSASGAALAADLGAELSEERKLLVDAHQMTTVPGVYAIGDIVSGLNQISVAVGQAAVAATHLHNQLPFRPREAQAAAHRGKRPARPRDDAATDPDAERG